MAYTTSKHRRCAVLCCVQEQFGKQKSNPNLDTFHQNLCKRACQKRQFPTVELRLFNSVGSVRSGYPRQDCQLCTTPWPSPQPAKVTGHAAGHCVPSGNWMMAYSSLFALPFDVVTVIFWVSCSHKGTPISILFKLIFILWFVSKHSIFLWVTFSVVTIIGITG